MANLLDFMSPEDKEKAIARGKKRLAKASDGGKAVSPEMFVIAEFGYYFGFEGIMAIKRGYIEKINDKGEVVQEPFTLDEVLALSEAAKKVWYGKVVDQAKANMIAGISKFSDKPDEAFNKNMGGFINKATISPPKPKPNPTPER